MNDGTRSRYERTYDEECQALAIHFTSDISPETMSGETLATLRHELAKAIQETVEDFLYGKGL